MGIQGRVVVQFVIERDGSIDSIKVVKKVSPELDAEAVRIVKAMPKWIPGRQNGFPIRMKYVIPITFRP
jgi:protein TonB